MTDIEKIKKIKEEIERLKHTDTAYDRSRFMLLLQIEDFIDSLPEEHNEDLEGAAKNFIINEFPPYVTSDNDGDVEFAYNRAIATFIAGAEWQKQKDIQDFMEKACEWLSKQPMSRPVFWTIEQFKNYMENEM